MIRTRIERRALAPYLIIPVFLLLGGCATPPEVKIASRGQLELIGALDDATVALNEGITHFHEDQRTRIFDEGRILIARVAINAAVADANAAATADGTFKVAKEKVRPWIDNAFSGPVIDAAIAKTQARLSVAIDPFVLGGLQNDLDDLKLLKATLSHKPQDIARLEAIIQSDADLETITSEHVANILRILRAQIDLMKTSSITVDNWLTIDITLSKQQADSLEKAFSDAKTALDKGAK